MTPPRTTTADDRQYAGVRQVGALMNYWLARSNWHHKAIAAVCDWACGETTPMQHSVISRIRNSHQARGAGLVHLDILSELNRAVWTWHVQGAAKAIEEFGLFSSWGVEQPWLDDAVWLPKPSDASRPLDLGDFALLAVGRLELPYLAPWQVGRTEAIGLCAAVAPLLDQIASERGWGPGKAAKNFLAAYPSIDTKRHVRLRALLTGDKPLAPSELTQELPALAEMIRRVRELANYGPADLQAELSKGFRLVS